MNDLETSILSFLVNALIRANSKTDFNLIIQQFGKYNLHSSEFHEVVDVYKSVLADAPDVSEIESRINYFDEQAELKIKSVSKAEKVAGEALKWGIQMYRRDDLLINQKKTISQA